jgi:hypothetical protein
MDSGAQETLLLKCDEAVRLVKRIPAGSKIYLHVWLDLPIEGEPDKLIPCGGSTSVELSRKEALRVAQELLTPLMEERGARVRIAVHPCHNYTAYWIG